MQVNPINSRPQAEPNDGVSYGVCLALLLSATLTAGCAGETPQASLAGTAKFDGEPISEGTLQLHPIDPTVGKPAGAKISEGKFSIGSDQGLSPGEYRASISAWKDTGNEIPNPEPLEGEPEMIKETVQYIPTDYNLRSGLKLTLKPGGNSHDFALDKLDNEIEPEDSKGKAESKE